MPRRRRRARPWADWRRWLQRLLPLVVVAVAGVVTYQAIPPSTLRSWLIDRAVDLPALANALEAAHRWTLPRSDRALKQAPSRIDLVNEALAAGRPDPSAGALSVDSVARLRQALEQATPGGVIVLAAGDYLLDAPLQLTVNGERSQPIRLTARQPGNVTLRVAGDTGVVISGRHWIVDSLRIASACHPVDRCERGILLVSGADHALIARNLFNDFDRAVDVVGSSASAAVIGGRIESNTLYNHEPRESPLALAQIGIAHARGWTVAHNTVMDFANDWGGRESYAVRLGEGAVDSRVQGNRVLCETEQHSLHRQGGVLVGPSSTGAQVSANLIIDCPMAAGVRIRRAGGAVVQNNSLLNTGNLAVSDPETPALVINNLLTAPVVAEGVGWGVSEGNRVVAVTTLWNTLLDGKVLSDSDRYLAPGVLQGGVPATTLAIHRDPCGDKGDTPLTEGTIGAIDYSRASPCRPFGRARAEPVRVAGGTSTLALVKPLQAAAPLKLSPVAPPPGTRVKDSTDFQRRCSQPGVLLCDPLDYGEVTGERISEDAPNRTLPAALKGRWKDWRWAVSEKIKAPPTLDVDEKASGSGSLKFTIVSHSGAGDAGNLQVNFSTDKSIHFGEHSTFFVQWRQRFSCDLLYTDCDPASPGYKSERRKYRTRNGKWTAFKNVIINTGDHPQLDKPTNSCTTTEVVINHIQDHALAGYHSCKWFKNFTAKVPSSRFGSNQIDHQPGGDTHCYYWLEDSGRRSGWQDSDPACFRFEADEWMTFQVQLSTGEWQPRRTGPPASNIKVWAAREGQPSVLVIDRDFHNNGPKPDFLGYGKVWLVPYLTGKDGSEAHPNGHIWYDELIISRARIDDPR